ncbi:hypothetical protein [Streptomyces sp. NPDC007088]|uniref:hypothetical protein n=1 Tax=Streptomyces sp. NPDC007088 TaxID=3364773 RepID=UPI0036C140C2
MRPITGNDITDFHNGSDDLLVLTATGEFSTTNYSDIANSSYGDNRATAYDYVTLTDGTEVQVLMERSTIDDGEFFEDALDSEGRLIPSVAQEMADITNTDGILPGRLQKAHRANELWETETARLAQERAKAVAEVVAFCGGNQSAAARAMGMDQSTVNKLVQKVRRAEATA